MKRIFGLILLFACIPALSQNQPPGMVSVGVLRMKNANDVMDSRGARIAFERMISDALRASLNVVVADSGAIAAALTDEEIDPEGQINVEKYLRAGKKLGVDIAVVGTVYQRGLTLYCHTRVYSAVHQTLKHSFSTAASVYEMPALMEMTASKLLQVIRDSVIAGPIDPQFVWKKELRLAFGNDRLDLKPPIAYMSSDIPPFEISVRCNMAKLNIGWTVSDFAVYADDQLIADIYPTFDPPKQFKKRDVNVSGTKLWFQVTVDDVRMIPYASFVMASMVIAAGMSE